MASTTTRPRARWSHLVATAVGLSAVLLVALTNGASATGNEKSKGHDQPIPHSVIKQLHALKYQQAIAQAKADITQRQAVYGLLFNGDGPKGPDRAKWGDEIFTPESPFIAYDPELAILPDQTFYSRQPLIDKEVARQPTVWPNTENLNGSMHYMYTPFFDEVTPTTAKTRTPAMIVNAVKGTRTVNTITLCVYHDTWKKTPDGWRKTESKWYRIS